MSPRRKNPDDQPVDGLPGADADAQNAALRVDGVDPVTDAPAPVAEPDPVPASEGIATPDLPPPASVPPVAPSRSTGILPGLLGGAMAGAAVFGLLHYVLGVPEPAGLATQIAALDKRLTAADDRLAGLSSPARDQALTDRLDGFETRLAEVSTASAELADLRNELASLRNTQESPPDSGDAAAVAALQSELAALRAQIAELPAGEGFARQLQDLQAAVAAERAATEARAAALQAEAEAGARAALARAAVLRAQAALDSGGAIGPALADLTAAGLEVPASLTAHAAGVSTLLALQTGFPDAARAALAATADLPQDQETLTGRFGAFLKSQTGMRSLTPREGDDPDAILSRAEAALARGDLPASLAQLDTLPDAGRAAIADWRTAAEARIQALAALAGLPAGPKE